MNLHSATEKSELSTEDIFFKHDNDPKYTRLIYKNNDSIITARNVLIGNSSQPILTSSPLQRNLDLLLLPLFVQHGPITI